MEEFDEFDEVEEKKDSKIRKLFFIIILIIGLIFIYSKYIGPTDLMHKEYVIKSDKLNNHYDGVTIAHFSDIHYGRTIKLKELKNIVNKINYTKPDIIVFTGDLIDKKYSYSDQDINDITLELSKLKSTYGKFYISGEHDLNSHYDGIMLNAKFTNLNDKASIILNKNNENMLIAGINYKSTGEYLDELFKNNLPEYKILLMHTPDTIDNLKKYNFDLALAGHSHGGQIKFPILGIFSTPEGAKNYYNEYYKVDNTELYISSGLGTTKFDFRFNNRPSFNLYRLKNNK